jgi:hypothetical protein
MTMTNTPNELRKFTDKTKHRRNVRAIVGVAAGVVLVVGGVTCGLILSGSSSSGPQPVNHPTPAPSIPTTRNLSFAPAKPLASSIPVTKLRGPQNLGAAAFGDIWATTGAPSNATLYRLSVDGRHVLSQTPYPGVNQNLPNPVRVGTSMVVADGAKAQYTVFGSAGNTLGTIRGEGNGAIVGDASGGWLTTSPHTLASIDSSGLHITREIQLPGNVNVVGIAASPGRLWAIDTTGSQLLRVDTANGRITGHTNLTSGLTTNTSVSTQPFEVSYLDNAVYVGTQDYGLRRIDPNTMKVTASIFSQTSFSWPVLGDSTNGTLWAQPAIGEVAQLDPTTLHTIRNIRVFRGSGDGGTFGAVITGSRLYLTNGDTNKMYSFPLR